MSSTAVGGVCSLARRTSEFAFHPSVARSLLHCTLAILASLQLIAHPKDYTQPAAQQGAVWEYLGDYWRSREAKEWANCPDIY